MEQLIKQIQDGLLEGDAQVVKDLTEKALAVGINAKTIIKEGLLPAMKIVGQQLHNHEIFIPDVLMSSRAMHASLYVLRPLLTSFRYLSKGCVVMGTVAGDLHDIGKNMVAMMLEGAGYTVIDAGIDVPAEDFVKAVRKYKPDILALSALLTTTMGEMQTIITQLKEEGLRYKTKVLVGGGPITPEFALAIEADAYAADSYYAVEAANRLMTGEVGFISVT